MEAEVKESKKIDFENLVDQIQFDYKSQEKEGCASHKYCYLI